jgi:hypothetical protein
MKKKVTKSKQKRAKLEEVGYVTVDAGLMYLGDPCYLAGPKENPFENWSDFCDVALDPGVTPDPNLIPIPHTAGAPGKGIVIGGFGGDGIFPVFIKRGKSGLVKEIVIKFPYADWMP